MHFVLLLSGICITGFGAKNWRTTYRKFKEMRAGQSELTNPMMTVMFGIGLTLLGLMTMK